MICLHYLLVYELVPRLGVQLIVKVEVIAVSLLGLELGHFLAVPDFAVDRGSQVLSLCLLRDFLAILIETNLIGLRRKAYRFLPSSFVIHGLIGSHSIVVSLDCSIICRHVVKGSLLLRVDHIVITHVAIVRLVVHCLTLSSCSLILPVLFPARLEQKLTLVFCGRLSKYPLLLQLFVQLEVRLAVLLVKRVIIILLRAITVAHFRIEVSKGR